MKPEPVAMKLMEIGQNESGKKLGFVFSLTPLEGAPDECNLRVHLCQLKQGVPWLADSIPCEEEGISAKQRFNEIRKLLAGSGASISASQDKITVLLGESSGNHKLYLAIMVKSSEAGEHRLEAYFELDDQSGIRKMVRCNSYRITSDKSFYISLFLSSFKIPAEKCATA